MTIDQNQTPVGEEEAQPAENSAEQASHNHPVPSFDGTDTPMPEAHEELAGPDNVRDTAQPEGHQLPNDGPDHSETSSGAKSYVPEPEAQQSEVPQTDAASDPVAQVEDHCAPIEAEQPGPAPEEVIPAAAEAQEPSDGRVEAEHVEPVEPVEFVRNEVHHAPEAEQPQAEQPVAEHPVTAATPTHAPRIEVVAVDVPGVGRDEKADAALFEAAMRGELGEDFTNPEGGYKRLSKGERIEATIVHVDRDKVFVDLGTKAEGIVPLGELSEENLETAKGHFHVGDKISVIVLRTEGAEGNPIVSKKRAEFEEAWDRIEEAFKDQIAISAMVVDRVKGGLVVDVGVRGFVPATHVGSGKLRNIEKYVGQPLTLKVIEIDRERKKVVLSNRMAEEERKTEAKEAIFRDVKPGDILEGTVRRLTDYGAFVDLGGVDGLLHISEMSWARINHPKEMFKEGQKIKVMVLRLDQGAGKISLGHRQVLPDPWNLIKQTYTVGQKLTVTISRIVQSGAFIRLPEGAEAFMPVSEMSARRIKRPQDVIEENQEVEAQIIDLRPDERRMVLSMRAIGGGMELRGGERPATPGGGYEEERRGPGGPGKDAKRGKKKAGGRGREEFEEFDDFGGAGRRGFATSGATIGERLGMLKGFLSRDEDDEETPVETDGESDSETAESGSAVEPTSAPPRSAPPTSVPEAKHGSEDLTAETEPASTTEEAAHE